MQIKLSEILIGGYAGVSHPEHPSCDPSEEEIEKAVRENNLETRGYQEHCKQLVAEWNQQSHNFDEYNARERQYHAQRIAFFVVNSWDNHPIILKKDGRSIHDGLHRAKAAKHRRMKTVPVRICDDPRL